ncbi:MAG: hypothetical protein KGI79_00875 [Patescibacteria group bacterium]|nr:hypothetical protein [Patescibacteria group bacterium]MDE2116416.1 hypothetical protein [Patescibacteria group bacterium]
MKKAFIIGASIVALTLFSASTVFAAATLAPAAASQANLGACSSLTTYGLTGVVSCIISILNNLVILLIAGAVVYIVYGAFEMIRSEEKRESGRQTIVYGIIGLFVMISIWGFVNILSSTFKLQSGPITPPALVNQ